MFERPYCANCYSSMDYKGESKVHSKDGIVKTEKYTCPDCGRGISVTEEGKLAIHCRSEPTEEV